jgi:hypothetical protein
LPWASCRKSWMSTKSRNGTGRLWQRFGCMR